LHDAQRCIVQDEVEVNCVIMINSFCLKNKIMIGFVEIHSDQVSNAIIGVPFALE